MKLHYVLIGLILYVKSWTDRQMICHSNTVLCTALSFHFTLAIAALFLLSLFLSFAFTIFYMLLYISLSFSLSSNLNGTVLMCR